MDLEGVQARRDRGGGRLAVTELPKLRTCDKRPFRGKGKGAQFGRYLLNAVALDELISLGAELLLSDEFDQHWDKIKSILESKETIEHYVLTGNVRMKSLELFDEG